MKEIQEILNKYFKQCFGIHGVQIPDKYHPYLLQYGKEIHNRAVDKCIENAEFFITPSYKNVEGDITELDKESLEKLKL